MMITEYYGIYNCNIIVLCIIVLVYYVISYEHKLESCVVCKPWFIEVYTKDCSKERYNSIDKR